MTIEYIIISILAAALLLTSWRKRVWKRRAFNVPSFWQQMFVAFITGLVEGVPKSKEFPEFIDDK